MTYEKSLEAQNEELVKLHGDAQKKVQEVTEEFKRFKEDVRSVAKRFVAYDGEYERYPFLIATLCRYTNFDPKDDKEWQ